MTKIKYKKRTYEVVGEETLHLENGEVKEMLIIRSPLSSGVNLKIDKKTSKYEEVEQ